jgi:general secretion pathway protein G
MHRRAGQRRDAFTLIELVVVVMILGIIASIAAPKLLATSDTAVDNGLRQTLSVIREAIDTYAAQNADKLPGADGDQATLKSDLADYLRGGRFPECPVGAENAEVRMLSGNGSHVPGIAATAATHSWVYKYDEGEFYVNSTDASADGTTTYDEF